MNMLAKCVFPALILGVMLVLPAHLAAQTSSQIPAGADNYLQVSNSTSAGGLDEYVVVFFEIPDTEIQPLYFAVYDPDIYYDPGPGPPYNVDRADSSSAHPAWLDPPGSPSTTFYLVGGAGALSNPDSKLVDYANAGKDPLAAGLGTILRQFSNSNTAANEEWVYFQVVYPGQGEHIGNKYYFKIIARAESTSGWIKNGFKLDVSYNNGGAPTGVVNAISFAYSWSVYLKDSNTWDIHPFVPVGAAGGDIVFYNWDMDSIPAGEQLTSFNKSETPLAAPPVSGDSTNKYGDAGSIVYNNIALSETNGTWRLHIQETDGDNVGDNDNMAEFWFTDGSADSAVVFRAYSQAYKDPPLADHLVMSFDDGTALPDGLDFEPISLQVVDDIDNPVDDQRQVYVTLSSPSGNSRITEVNGTSVVPPVDSMDITTDMSGQAYFKIVDPSAENVVVTVYWDGTGGISSWGNAGNDSLTVTFTNTPAPFILNRYTVDRNSDGYLDAVRIVFNTNINDASVPTGTPLGYAVSGASGLGFTSTTGGLDTSGDNDIYLTFTDGVLSSGATPNVSYARPPGTTTDSAANVMPSQAAAPARDRVGPAIVSAHTYSTTTVEITFSENIDDASLAGTDFVFGGFATAGANGQGTGFDTGAFPNDNVVIVFFAVPIGTDETGTVQLNAVAAVRDSVGNNSAQTAPVAVSDGIITLEDVVPQKGGVAIVNNVINPGAGQSTRLLYRLKHSGNVKIQVFSLAGDIVAVLLSARQAAGEHDVTWDGRNSGGRIVAKGIYFIRIVGPGVDETRKVLVVK